MAPVEVLVSRLAARDSTPTSSRRQAPLAANARAIGEMYRGAPRGGPEALSSVKLDFYVQVGILPA